MPKESLKSSQIFLKEKIYDFFCIFLGATSSKIHPRKEDLWRSSNASIELGWKKVALFVYFTCYFVYHFFLFI